MIEIINFKIEPLALKNSDLNGTHSIAWFISGYPKMSKSPYSVQIPKNSDQENFVSGQFSRSAPDHDIHNHV